MIDQPPRPERVTQPRTIRPRVLAALGAVAIAGGVLLAAIVGAATSPAPAGSGGIAANPSGSGSGSPLPSNLVPSGAPASIAPSSSPRASNSGPTPKPTPAAPLRLPFKGNGVETGQSVLTAPGPNGGVYVRIQTDDREHLALLDRQGRPVAGWPRRVAAPWCWQLLSAPDGTARVLCDAPSSGDGLQASVTRIFSFQPNGHPTSDWPIDVEGAVAGRMIGNELVVLAIPYMGDTTPDGSTETVHLVRLAPDGRPRTGSDVTYACCETALAIGPAGRAAVATHRDPGEPPQTTITLFDEGGVRAGSPIVIDGDLSRPAFDAAGRIYLALDATTGSGPGTRRIVLDRDGAILGTSAQTWPITSTDPWLDQNAQSPGPLVVAPDGMNFVVQEDSAGMSILMVDRSDTVPDDWPYRSSLAAARIGLCEPGEIDCGRARVDPIVGLHDSLFVAHAAPSAASGGRIVALDLAGHVRSGWPVTLKRAGSAFWSMTAAPGGGVWAVAIEPEPRGHSATILSISDGGTVRWATTIVEP